jgi:hypothetical protein
MSARQRVLRHHALADQFVPLDSARVPLFGPITDCLWGRGRRSANVAVNVPNDASTIASDWGRGGHKNPDANTLFWLDLTIFRMNTCAKRVGGWAVPMFRNLVFVAAAFRRAESQAVITRAGPKQKYALAPRKSGPRDLQFRFGCRTPLALRIVAFKGAVFPRRDPGLACNCTPGAIALQCGSRFG